MYPLHAPMWMRLVPIAREVVRAGRIAQFPTRVMQLSTEPPLSYQCLTQTPGISTLNS